MESTSGAFLTSFILIICAALFLQVITAEGIFYTKVKETIILEDGKVAQVEVTIPNTTMQIFQNITLFWLVTLIIAFIIASLAYISEES